MNDITSSISTKFPFTQRRRNILIASSSFLILNYIISGIGFLFTDTSLSTFGEILINSGYFLSFGYIYYTLTIYFKHLGSKVLEMFSILILIIECTNILISTINSAFLFIPPTVIDLLSTPSMLAQLIWIILVIRLKTITHPSMTDLKKFAWTNIISMVLSVAFGFTFSLSHTSGYSNLMAIPWAIPYIFLIMFALRLTKEADTNHVNTSK